MDADEENKIAMATMKVFEVMPNSTLLEATRRLEGYLETLDIIPEYLTEMLRMLQLEYKHRSDQ